MNKNELMQTILILIIVVSVLVVGYVLVGLKNKAINQYHNSIAFPPIVDGKQIIKMTVYAGNFIPEYFKVRSGIPVRWEITSSGQASCGGKPIIAKDLLNGDIIANYLVDGDQIYLNPDAGQITMVEFIAPRPGLYRFNCPNNMISGAIESNN